MAEGVEGIPLTEKVAFLSAMPGVDRVIETHMAFVFLTADFAFKLKKPVRFDYFDHRPLAARARACAEEVRLNRALAGGVYLGTVSLTTGTAGLAIGGDGRAVDSLVHMRRLPADRMLDALIAVGTALPTEAEVAGLVAHLARFYHQQQMTPPPAGMYLRHLRREQAVNSEHLRQMALFLPDVPLEPVTAELENRLTALMSEIVVRQALGLVVEGHGDLRPEHVCLTDPPVIFDRAETALELRVVDVFDEVGYLAAECRFLGLPNLGRRLLQGLAQTGFAPPSRDLLTIYARIRLVTRARLAVDHLRDPVPSTPEKWPVRARAYLTEALRLSDL